VCDFFPIRLIPKGDVSDVTCTKLIVPRIIMLPINGASPSFLVRVIILHSLCDVHIGTMTSKINGRVIRCGFQHLGHVCAKDRRDHLRRRLWSRVAEAMMEQADSLALWRLLYGLVTRSH
jgi:hypothetical protein